jgi:ankyrin repeat protein
MSDATYAAIEKWIWSQEGPSMSGWAKIEMKMPVKSASFGVYDKRKGYQVDNLHFLCNEIDTLCETEITRPAAVSLLRSFIWRWDRKMLSGKNGVLFDEVMEAIKQQQHGGGITAVSKNEASLLHIVALLNKVEFIGILLQWGAEVDVGAGKLGTPLHFAALSGGTEAVLFFLDQGANADAIDSQGMAPFMKAYEAGKETTAQILIRRTTDVMLQAQVTLTMACKEGLKWAVQELLHRGVSLDQDQQRLNQTPIYYACQGGHAEILKLLLDYGATINSSKRPVENQLFVAAVDSGSKVTIKLLIESDPAHFLFTKTTRRESVLHIACKMGLSSGIVQWLVDAGAENNGVDIDERSALHHAVLAGNDELIDILLNAKVDINIKDNKGLTALDLAVQRNNITAIVYILDWISTLDKNGNSTLHLASAIDNVKVIDYINYRISRARISSKKKKRQFKSSLGLGRF